MDPRAFVDSGQVSCPEMHPWPCRQQFERTRAQENGTLLLLSVPPSEPLGDLLSKAVPAAGSS